MKEQSKGVNKEQTVRRQLQMADTSGEIQPDPPQQPSINIEEQLKDIIHDSKNTPQSKVMDLQIVLQMFQQITQDLNQIKQDTSAEKIRTIITNQESEDREIVQLRTQLEEEKTKNQVLKSAMVGMAKTVKNLDQRIVTLEKQNINNNILITGFLGSSDKRRM